MTLLWGAQSVNSGKHKSSINDLRNPSTIDRPPVQNWFDGILLGLVLLCLGTDWPRHRYTGCLTYQYVEFEALEFLRQKQGRTEGPEAVCTFAKKLHEQFGGRSKQSKIDPRFYCNRISQYIA
jgi:hypothetical protein